jgi:hypothetical protein
MEGPPPRAFQGLEEAGCVTMRIADEKKFNIERNGFFLYNVI